MTHATRRFAFVTSGSLVVALAIAACSQGTSSTAPSATTTIATPSPLATAAPSPSPSASGAAASPSSATACTPLPASVALPTDRVTSVTVTPGTTFDTITFVFGDSSLPGPVSPPMGSLEIAHPPYTQAGSGSPIVMTGDHVLQLRFTGMSLQNDAGEEMFTGPTELTPNLPALRKAVQFDASEGVVGWYIGYDGTGCVGVSHDHTGVTLTIDHS
jgi:hypothetical protein